SNKSNISPIKIYNAGLELQNNTVVIAKFSEFEHVVVIDTNEKISGIVLIDDRDTDKIETYLNELNISKYNYPIVRIENNSDVYANLQKCSKKDLCHISLDIFMYAVDNYEITKNRINRSETFSLEITGGPGYFLLPKNYYAGFNLESLKSNDVKLFQFV
ncbi:MAG: hypothetical protein MHPSP_004728, partial [Paramarteilia canceri]